jgi:hypothetical protein
MYLTIKSIRKIKIYIIGLDNTFFQGVKLGLHKEIFEYSTHYKEAYSSVTDMSHHFPNGLSDYFHFISQNFFALTKYFGDPCFVNLDSASLIDAFGFIQNNQEECAWILNTY